MAESTQPVTEVASLPKRVCEKCRNECPLDQFQHGVEHQDCVCKRCLRVMGYGVK